MGNSSCTICEDSASLKGKRKLDQLSQKADDNVRITEFSESSR